ncbi:MAG: glutathione S-transferase family protein [Gammaproteobacteria bacterium]
MKLYDFPGAPNPRRVRIFLAEKGIEVPSVTIDIRQGAHKTPEFLRKNPSGKLPVLELDDGRCIGESVAICRYFEAIHPQPSLFGTTPYAMGRIDMANRILEFELLAPIGAAWVNGPVVAQMAPGRFKQNQQAKESGEAATRQFYTRLDHELTDREFMADNGYSIADITALCTIDFATAMVDLEPAAELKHLWRWHAAVSARPSAKA